VNIMSHLSTLLVALHCAVYVYVEINGAESRPLDFIPSEEDATVGTRVVTEYEESRRKEVEHTMVTKFNRLPGLCRRLKRRRITILCNTEKFCSPMRYSQINHTCACPKRS
ncbi:hypothetical protein DNTS_008047, partial [Danionella cerebrum]